MHAHFLKRAVECALHDSPTVGHQQRHPNVVLLMGISTERPHLAIITEYCARGSLFRLLHHSETPLDMRRRVKMMIGAVVSRDAVAARVSP